MVYPKDYQEVYETYLNGNISDAREKVQAMSPDRLLNLVISIIELNECDNVGRFLRLMRSH